MTLCTDAHPATNTFRGRVCWKDTIEGVDVEGRGMCQWWPLTHTVDSTFKFNIKRGSTGWDRAETDEEFNTRVEEEKPNYKQKVTEHLLGITMEWSDGKHQAHLEVRLEEADLNVFLHTAAGRHEPHARSLPPERLRYRGHPLRHPLRVRLCHLDATMVVESIPPLQPDFLLRRKKLIEREKQGIDIAEEEEQLEREEALFTAQPLTHLRYQLPMDNFYGVCMAAYPKTRICAHLPPLFDPGGALQLMRDQRLAKERKRQAEIGVGLIPPASVTQEDRVIWRHCTLLDRGIDDILNTKPL